jgi:Tfp pilus assembly protein PilX
MLKSRKGSITVIALVMLLLLVLMAGAWVVMMTQERTNAAGDERQQQAWYAAEAGYRRVAELLRNDNDAWTQITTKDADLKTNDTGKYTKVALDLGTVSDKGPWYAVSIVSDPTSTRTDLTVAASSGVTYEITSVGYYMGEIKIVKYKFTKTATGGGTTPPHSNPSPASQPGVVNANGTITIYNNTGSINGSIYGKTVTDNTGGKLATGHVGDWSTYNGVNLTNIPAAIFNTKNYTFDGTLKVDPQQASTITLAANKNYYLYYTTTVNDRTYIDITAESGSVLYLEHPKKIGPVVYLKFKGPTSGEPATIIFGNSGNTSTTINYEEYGTNALAGTVSGRVRIIANGTLTLANAADFAVGKYMILCDNDIFQNAPLKVAYLSSNGNIYMYKEFTGVAVAKGSIGVHTNITYDNSIATDSYFNLPAGMTAGW